MTQTHDHRFCRTLLAVVMRRVRKHTTAKQRSQAWPYNSGLIGDTAEFHGPDGFYWHGRACCLWEARAKGWQSWMESREELRHAS